MTAISNGTVEIRRLGDIAEIIPGYSTGKALVHDPDGTHQVVLSKHLTPGLRYSYTEGDAFRIRPFSTGARASGEPQWRNISRYELRCGDVLFMSRGARNVATPIESVPVHSVAPVSFFIIRLKEPEPESAYLTWYLNAPKAQNEIANIRTGAGTPIIQRSAFSDLKIPVPARATQQQIGALGESMVRESMLHDSLRNALDRSHDAASAAIAHRLFDAANNSIGESE